MKTTFTLTFAAALLLFAAPALLAQTKTSAAPAKKTAAMPEAAAATPAQQLPKYQETQQLSFVWGRYKSQINPKAARAERREAELQHRQRN